MSRRPGFNVNAPILVFSFGVLLAPMLLWYMNVEHPAGHVVLTGEGPIVERDPIGVVISVGVPLLALIGSALGLFKSVKKEGAVAPLQITFAAVCASFALLGTRILLISEPVSVLARTSEQHHFRYAMFIFIFSVATITLLAVAIKEQYRTKSTGSANPLN